MATAGRLNAPAPDPVRQLRICADPNNLPYSNQRQEGFENELGRIVARDLGRSVIYFWWPQRRGFIRNTLRAGMCDVVMGVPSSFEMALTTRPYYRSTYVFVSRRDRRLDINSMDDPALRRFRIGVHVVGDDYANVPPAQALANRGMARNIAGYSIYGDYSKESPPADLIRAVTRGDVDVAIAWGPLAGYFAKSSVAPLDVVAVPPEAGRTTAPFVFDISMAVRREDQALRNALNRVIERRRDEIRTLLKSYGVPLILMRS